MLATMALLSPLAIEYKLQLKKIQTTTPFCHSLLYINIVL